MKKTNRDILALALPSIVTNITTPLLGLVDVAITGHMGSAVYLAAIAVGSTVFNLLYWLVSFIRMSASGMTAQAFGRGDLRDQSLILSRELLVSTVIGLCFIALSPLLASPLIHFVDPTDESSALALRYFRIAIWGAPAVLATYGFSGWFLGRQNSRIPMWVSILINVSNILISLVLVFGLGWRIEGVATGTLAAQWIGALAFMVMALRQHLSWPGWKPVLAPREIARFFRTNGVLFLRTVCMIAVTLWFTRTGASQGNVILAANALLLQLFMLFSYVMDGYAFAGEALVGRDIGRRDVPELRQTVKALLWWSASLAAAFTILYILGGEWFLGILSDDRQVTQASAEYAAWAFAIPLVSFAAFAYDGIFIGTTSNKMMLLPMLYAAIAFFAVYLAAYGPMGNHGLWLAFLAYLLTRSISQAILWPGMLRRIDYSIRKLNIYNPS